MSSNSSSYKASLRGALPYLKMVAIGAVFWVVDFRTGLRIGSSQVAFDLIPDWIGLVLIAVGMVALATLRGDGIFDVCISLSAGLAIFWAGGEIAVWFSPTIREGFGRAAPILAPLGTLGIPLASWAIQRLATLGGLQPTAVAWRRTSFLALAFWTIPALIGVFFGEGNRESQALLFWLFLIPGLLVVVSLFHGIAVLKRDLRRPDLSNGT